MKNTINKNTTISINGSKVNSQVGNDKVKADYMKKQQELQNAGLYLDGKIDGIWGEKSIAAYREYTKSKSKPKPRTEPNYIEINYSDVSDNAYESSGKNWESSTGYKGSSKDDEPYHGFKYKNKNYKLNKGEFNNFKRSGTIKLADGGIVNPYSDMGFNDTAGYKGVTSAVSSIPGVGGLIGGGMSLLGETGIFDFIGKGSREKKEREWQAEQDRLEAESKAKARVGFDANRAMNKTTSTPTSLYAKGTNSIMPREDVMLTDDMNKMVMKDGSRLHRIGNGFEVAAANTGKDTVPMNIAGQNVKVDDKEILIPRADGGVAVISDDNGEADKYRADINKGFSKTKIAEKYIARAGMLKNKNTTKKLAFGTDQLSSASHYLEDAGIGKFGENGGKSGNFLKNVFTKDNIGTGIDVLGAGVTTFQNQKAMNDLKDLHRPTYNPAPYSAMNPDANKGVYDNTRSEINRSSANFDKAVLENTSNSNTALAMKASNKAKTTEDLSKVGSQEVSNRNSIMNANTQGANAYSMNVNQNKTAFEEGQYQTDVNLINTQLGLNQSNMNNIQGVRQVNQAKDFDRERLDLLGKGYGVDTTSPDTMYSSSLANLKKQLAGYSAGSPEYKKIESAIKALEG